MMINENGLQNLRKSIFKAKLVYGNAIEIIRTYGYDIIIHKPVSVPGYLRLPECITKIDDTSFSNCDNIYKLEIESKYGIEIGDLAFSNCCNLREVSIKAPSYKIGCGVFKGCTRLEEIKLYNGCVKIGDYAFSSTAIKELKIPESCQDIGGLHMYEL